MWDSWEGWDTRLRLPSLESEVPPTHTDTRPPNNGFLISNRTHTAADAANANGTQMVSVYIAAITQMVSVYIAAITQMVAVYITAITLPATYRCVSVVCSSNFSSLRQM